MAKFYGKVGFASFDDRGYGVSTPTIIERTYSGELLKINRSSAPGASINDNIDITNEISLLVDAFANENLSSIVYIDFMGSRWKVKSVQPAYPRIILTTGGVYNG